MLARSLIQLYLSPAYHGITNWDKGWGGRVNYYAPLYVKGKHLLALHCQPLPKGRLAPICCGSCLAVSELEVPYGKLLPHCPMCKGDRVDLNVKGKAWRDVLIATLWPSYDAVEAELIICLAIQDMKNQKHRKLANPSANVHNTTITLRERLQRSLQS